jgi:hypothetical protein
MVINSLSRESYFDADIVAEYRFLHFLVVCENHPGGLSHRMYNFKQHNENGIRAHSA